MTIFPDEKNATKSYSQKHITIMEAGNNLVHLSLLGGVLFRMCTYRDKVKISSKGKFARLSMYDKVQKSNTSL